MSNSYLSLPCDASPCVIDRYDVLSDYNEDTVPFWLLLEALLLKPISTSTELIDILETIAITLHGSNPTKNYDGLKAFLASSPIIDDDFWSTTWPAVTRIALKLLELFPEHKISVLSESTPKLVLSREQVSCLVIHQFLCTLIKFSGQSEDSIVDFSVWFPGEQPHAKAVDAYLTALFMYFARLASPVDERGSLDYIVEEWPITYELVSNDTGLHDGSKQHVSMLCVLQVNEASTAPRYLGLENGAAVISANKVIGFGRTGTQEEVHVGSSPEACIAVLFAPILKDNQVFVITGAEAMISIIGYGRHARLDQVLEPIRNREARRKMWSKRAMLFMDAQELDLVDAEGGVPVDLQPGNVDRDLRKALIAFRHKPRTSSNITRLTVYTGIWGCGTFGGNPEIKACIQWCAASLAGCDLVFVISGERHLGFAHKLERFVVQLTKLRPFAGDLQRVLLSMRPGDIVESHTPLDIVLEKLTTGNQVHP